MRIPQLEERFVKTCDYRHTLGVLSQLGLMDYLQLGQGMLL